ncbi:UDP-N-acetylmuramate dehydrogenase [Patescibacteria group bacterium]|nr:UDP-N-acetylmuramate dehydrogenase [Patescibacteria group bacterium]
MRVEENVPLAPRTTLGVGGEARFFIEAHTEQDIKDALACARQRALPLFVLGEGSNVLVPDAGVAGVVLKMALNGTTIEEEDGSMLLVAGAGTLWDDVVDEAGVRGVFGIENLAGIPGSTGGAAVQNIGAYGAELSRTFAYADTIDGATGVARRVERADAGFAYRTSFFKEHPECIITRVALRLVKTAGPNIAYADLARAQAEGAALTTPREIARAVRAIRALKFPREGAEGSAGSFFKNPVVSLARAQALAQQFPGLPAFPQDNGAVKLSLAWLLDHALSLKGFSKGNVRLYEKQPLVLVAQKGARAEEVDACARAVEERVLAATGIAIEREVETFGVRGYSALEHIS